MIVVPQGGRGMNFPRSDRPLRPLGGTSPNLGEELKFTSSNKRIPLD